MGLVESNVALFTTQTDPKDTLDEYYCVFKEQVDTIEAHGNNPQYHGTVYHKHYEEITVSKGYNTKMKMGAMGDT